MSVVLLHVLVRLPPDDYYDDRPVERAIRAACVRALVLLKANLSDTNERIPKAWRRAMKREHREKKRTPWRKSR